MRPLAEQNASDDVPQKDSGMKQPFCEGPPMPDGLCAQRVAGIVTSRQEPNLPSCYIAAALMECQEWQGKMCGGRNQLMGGSEDCCWMQKS